MNSSLQSYDLARLFLYTEPSISGGESLVHQEEVNRDDGVVDLPSSAVMTDSLSIVSWPTEFSESEENVTESIPT